MIEPSEVIKKLYGIMNNIVKVMPNFNINDVLNTDYDLLLNLLIEESKKEENEVMDLGEFVESL